MPATRVTACVVGRLLEALHVDQQSLMHVSREILVGPNLCWRCLSEKLHVDPSTAWTENIRVLHRVGCQLYYSC